MNIKEKFFSLFKFSNKSLVKSFLSDFNNKKLEFNKDKIITDYDLKNEELKLREFKKNAFVVFKNSKDFIQYAELGLIASIFFFLFLHPFFIFSLYLIITFLVFASSKKEKTYRYIMGKILYQEELIQEIDEIDRMKIKQITDANSECYDYIKNNLSTGRDLVKADLEVIKKILEQSGQIKEKEINETIHKIEKNL